MREESDANERESCAEQRLVDRRSRARLLATAEGDEEAQLVLTALALPAEVGAHLDRLDAVHLMQENDRLERDTLRRARPTQEPATDWAACHLVEREEHGDDFVRRRVIMQANRHEVA